MRKIVNIYCKIMFTWPDTNETMRLGELAVGWLVSWVFGWMVGWTVGSFVQLSMWLVP